MHRYISKSLFFVVAAGMLFNAFSTSSKESKIKSIIDNLQWYNNSAFELKYNNKVIYFDVYSDGPEDTADIVLYTHGNGDHFNPIALRNIVKPTTKIVSPKSCQTPALKEYNLELIAMGPGDSIEVDGMKVKAVYAYNIKKIWQARCPNSMGLIITIDGITLYHAGDTELIPEMKDFSCDIALMPLGQEFTMNSVEDAVQAVVDVKATVAIPMHWGSSEGTVADVQKFKNLLKGKGIDCIVKEPK